MPVDRFFFCCFAVSFPPVPLFIIKVILTQVRCRARFFYCTAPATDAQSVTCCSNLNTAIFFLIFFSYYFSLQGKQSANRARIVRLKIFKQSIRDD